MTSTAADEFDFALSQYADGTLPDGQRPAVERRLAVDPDARAVLAEYRRLGELLAAPPAGVNWAALSGHLSAAIDAGERPAVAGRSGFVRWAGMALAAAAVLAVGVRLMRPRAVAVAPHERETVAVAPPTVEPTVAVVSGPAVEAGGGTAVAEVKIGPSPALAARPGSWRYAEGVVSRPSTAVITSARGVPGHGWPH